MDLVRTPIHLPLPGGTLRASAANTRAALISRWSTVPCGSSQRRWTTFFIVRLVLAMARSRFLVNCNEMSCRRTALFWTLSLLPTVVGCGNGLARVSGTVTLDDRPAGGAD